MVRPPYGATGGNCKSALASMGYASILWSIDTLDWKTRNADSTVNSVLNNVKDGDIVLMHSIYSQTAAAVERIVPALVQRGFQLVTVSELAAARGQELRFLPEIRKNDLCRIRASDSGSPGAAQIFHKALALSY